MPWISIFGVWLGHSPIVKSSETLLGSIAWLAHVLGEIHLFFGRQVSPATPRDWRIWRMTLVSSKALPTTGNALSVRWDRGEGWGWDGMRLKWHLVFHHINFEFANSFFFSQHDNGLTWVIVKYTRVLTESPELIGKISGVIQKRERRMARMAEWPLKTAWRALGYTGYALRYV